MLNQAKLTHARQMAQLQQTLGMEADRSRQLEARTQELHEATSSKKAAQHAADSFSQQLKKLQQQLAEAHGETRLAELTAYNTQTDLECSQAACSELEATKGALKMSLDQASKKLQEGNAEVQAQQRLLQEAACQDDAAQAQVAKLELALLAAQGNHAASHAAAQKLDESSATDMASLQADHSKLQSLFDATSTKLETAQARLARQDQRCSDLQQALDAKQNSLDATSTALAAKDSESHVLTAAIDTLEAEVHSQRQLQAEQTERFAAASACLTELRSDFQSLQTSSDADSTQHAATADGQQQQIGQLRAELRACKMANASLQAAHEAMEGRMVILRAEVVSQEATVKQAGQEIEELQQTNAWLTLELKGSQASSGVDHYRPKTMLTVVTELLL